ncbi:unnamed protein product [Closterium sp. NIES-64]|nr:unnamed protein product [Closterium sp. Naga37s-1]CAI5952564.1 unnamed protein product [Closterium sp. NIES-64]CAI6005719.1 unnamed protein product [Closterium sp. NIES-65]
MSENTDAAIPKDPSLSYRYWVGPRGNGEMAAPPPMPRRLSQEELASLQRNDSKGSAWNQGGTWEERSLNDWAKQRLKELLRCSSPAVIGSTTYTLTTEVDSCSGDTTIVVVRNKRRHGYILDINVKISASSTIADAKEVTGTLTVHDATFGEVDDWEPEIKVEQGKGKLTDSEVSHAQKEVKRLVLPLLQGQMREFEKELLQR